MGKGGMPPKKSSLTSRRAKGGRSKPKGRMSDDDETALRLLEAEVDRLRQQLAATQSELETQQKQVAATIGGLTGTGRGLMRRSLEEKPASAGQGKAKRRKVELEPIRERKKRLEVELQSASNRRGRSRSYEENRTFIFSCLKLEAEVLESCTGNDRPILNKIADAVARMQGYDNKFGKLLMSNWRDDQSILVHESQTRGKGSPGYRDGTYIDTARRLAPEHLKAIEEYRRELHKTGGVCSVRTIVNHLNEKFEIEGSSQASLFPLPSRSCFRSSLP
jgi:hypothetical protein